MADDLELFDDEYQKWQNEQQHVAYAAGYGVELFNADGTPAVQKPSIVAPQRPRRETPAPSKTLVLHISNKHGDDKRAYLFAPAGKVGLIEEGSAGFDAIDDATGAKSLVLKHFDETVSIFLGALQAGRKAFQITWMNVTVQSDGRTGVYDTNALMFTQRKDQNGQLNIEKRLHGNTYGSPLSLLSNRMTMDLAARGQVVDATSDRALEIMIPGKATLILSFAIANEMDLTKSFEKATR